MKCMLQVFRYPGFNNEVTFTTQSRFAMDLERWQVHCMRKWMDIEGWLSWCSPERFFPVGHILWSFFSLMTPFARSFCSRIKPVFAHGSTFCDGHFGQNVMLDASSQAGRGVFGLFVLQWHCLKRTCPCAMRAGGVRGAVLPQEPMGDWHSEQSPGEDGRDQRGTGQAAQENVPWLLGVHATGGCHQGRGQPWKWLLHCHMV